MRSQVHYSPTLLLAAHFVQFHIIQINSVLADFQLRLIPLYTGK